MKVSFYLILIFICSCVTHVSAQPSFTNFNFNVQHADVSCIDIDGDGDLDILISGEDAGNRNLQLFKNDGTGTFTVATSPFKPVTRTTLIGMTLMEMVN